MAYHCARCGEGARRYAREHRPRQNELRRERRKKARAERLKDKHCMLCGINLARRHGRSRIFCADCLQTHSKKIRSLYNATAYYKERTISTNNK